MENKNAKSGAFATSSPSCRKYEEVLKYFPDEVFEPIELRPEELVSGEVYTIEDNESNKWTLQFKKLYHNKILCKKVVSHNTSTTDTETLIYYYHFTKFYHATPEEKKLLLGEEQTDWKAKFDELKAKYNKLNENHEKVLVYNDELTEKINQTEVQNNQEKVYFYFSNETDQFMHMNTIDKALVLSCESMDIYEAVKIGVKKSVLVNE